MTRSTVRWIGLGAGPALALIVGLTLPDSYSSGGEVVALSTEAKATAAVGVWMAVWWMTEAIEIFITALLPIVLFPLLGVFTIGEATAPYANELIFLFLGGLILALSMQRWGLEHRISRVALRLVGSNPHVVIGGFMVITVMFGLWVSNTATVAMMLPVALAVIGAVVPGGRDALTRHADVDVTAASTATGQADAATTGSASTNGESVPPEFQGRKFATALLLGVAWAASISGVGTLIASPPNLFLASFAREDLGVEISFTQWLAIGIPTIAVLLPIAWLLLTRVLFPPDVDRTLLEAELRRQRAEPLPPPSTGEKVTFVVFVCTALAWIFRPLLNDLTIAGHQPLEHLTDPGIAVIAVVALFAIPVDLERHEFTMDWATARQLPWGILMLFGGGLSLAAAISSTGVASYLAAQVEFLDGMPPVLIVLVVVTIIGFFTELTSNTATAAAFIPVFAAVAPALGVDPLLLIVPTTVMASTCFMLPAATPPNALVFGTGYITLPQMMRSGFLLTISSIVVVTALTFLVVVPVFGIDL